MTLRDLGLSLVRAFPLLDRAARSFYRKMPAQFHDTPTRRMEEYFRSGEAVYFVQIGAFDGLAGDPIRELALDNPHWRGLLIEPQVSAYRRLCGAYKSHAERFVFMNSAISGGGGKLEFYRIAEREFQSKRLPDWAEEIASLDASHIRKHFPDVEIEASEVETLTFADAVKAARLPRVDLLVIDVEGHERAILETVDVSAYGIRFVMYEHKHLSAEDRAFLTSLLGRQGLVSKVFGRDTIAARPT